MIEIPTDKARKTNARSDMTWDIQHATLGITFGRDYDFFSAEEQENLRQVLNYLHEQKED